MLSSFFFFFSPFISPKPASGDCRDRCPPFSHLSHPACKRKPRRSLVLPDQSKVYPSVRLTRPHAIWAAPGGNKLVNHHGNSHGSRDPNSLPGTRVPVEISHETGQKQRKAQQPGSSPRAQEKGGTGSVSPALAKCLALLLAFFRCPSDRADTGPRPGAGSRAAFSPNR